MLSLLELQIRQVDESTESITECFNEEEKIMLDIQVNSTLNVPHLFTRKCINIYPLHRLIYVVTTTKNRSFS